jgi:23S rRNA pseudouridine2605 synthase
MTEQQKERLAKVMARAGLCSRRDAELWIKNGRVKLNGVVWNDPAINVGTDDDIMVDGRPLPKIEDTRIWLMHKPTGCVTTARDPEGRRTVFSYLPKTMPRVVSIGRLDLNSEGLLLLTNDGALSRALELPQTGLPRRYRVRIYGRIERQELEELRHGIVVDGVQYGSILVDFENKAQDNLNQWVILTLHEGKNREIRRVMGALGVQVNRLVRLSYGPFELGALAQGEVTEVSSNIVANFKQYLRDKGAM